MPMQPGVAEDSGTAYENQRRPAPGMGTPNDPDLAAKPLSSFTYPEPANFPEQVAYPGYRGYDMPGQRFQFPEDLQAANRYGNQIPQYMGFGQAFKQQYPNLTPGAAKAVDALWSALNHLYSIGDPQNNKGWGPAAYTYTYDQFVRDAAVVIAARAGDVPEVESPAPAQPKESTARATGGGGNVNTGGGGGGKRQQ